MKKCGYGDLLRFVDFKPDERRGVLKLDISLSNDDVGLRGGAGEAHGGSFSFIGEEESRERQSPLFQNLLNLKIRKTRK